MKNIICAIFGHDDVFKKGWIDKAKKTESPRPRYKIEATCLRCDEKREVLAFWDPEDLERLHEKS